jgi:hydroxyethylthiazole kinase-like uncharacterized protein yjeF
MTGRSPVVIHPGPAFVAALRKGESAHKYGHGHAVILAGGAGQGGAGRLAARGALRIGAGLVTLACPPSALQENAARLDAVMLRPLLDEAAFAALLEDARLNALCLGPGMGQDRARAMVPLACRSGRRVVLDADALTAFSENPEEFWSLCHDGCVLTPHEGEFARLFPHLASALPRPEAVADVAGRTELVQEAARRSGAVVLLKGAETVIASPDGRTAINRATGDRAAPWLATAGSGDVLAGFITGLLARGFGPFEAACTACWLHAQAARSFGPGLIAEDLPEELPKVFRALGL